MITVLQNLVQAGSPRVSFAEPISNVTVAVGRDAALSCVVDNLGSHRVSIFSPFTHSNELKNYQLLTIELPFIWIWTGGMGSLGSANDPDHPSPSCGSNRSFQRLLWSSTHLASSHPRRPTRRCRSLHVPGQQRTDDKSSGPCSRRR